MRGKLCLVSISLLTACALGCGGPSTDPFEQPVVPDGLDVKAASRLLCPENSSRLRFASKKELDNINGRISAGLQKTWTSRIVETNLEAALIREDGKIGYRIEKVLPIIQIDEALVLDESVGNPNPKANRVH